MNVGGCHPPPTASSTTPLRNAERRRTTVESVCERRSLTPDPQSSIPGLMRMPASITRKRSTIDKKHHDSRDSGV
ncbi:hypothetical protein ZHAS_00014669 [Anopheles sinensis]|uniref:Uncharacterized protein n=1 Tax=Anopheles sinensis TaxID=74873 RepID=A0A084W8S8_ANOSI|nr:hypothetical protein ZHAS_00014669 [Anopheles sinensis]